MTCSGLALAQQALRDLHYKEKRVEHVETLMVGQGCCVGCCAGLGGVLCRVGSGGTGDDTVVSTVCGCIVEGMCFLFPPVILACQWTGCYPRVPRGSI